MKHTPGPWIVKDKPKGSDQEGLDVYGEDGEHWVCSVWESDQDANEMPQAENAALIARAPDLLEQNQILREALERIRNHANSDFDDPTDAAFRQFALRVAQDALRDIIGEEVAAQERGAK